MDDKTPFVPTNTVAAKLGLPQTFIRREASAGRIPHIRIGRRLFFNADAVAAALKDGKFLQTKEENFPDA